MIPEDLIEELEKIAGERIGPEYAVNYVYMEKDGSISSIVCPKDKPPYKVKNFPFEHRMIEYIFTVGCVKHNEFLIVGIMTDEEHYAYEAADALFSIVSKRWKH